MIDGFEFFSTGERDKVWDPFEPRWWWVLGHTKDTSTFNQGPDGNTDENMKLVIKVNSGKRVVKKTLDSKVIILKNMRIVKWNLLSIQKILTGHPNLI